jgi:hypothetical protein
VDDIRGEIAMGGGRSHGVAAPREPSSEPAGLSNSRRCMVWRRIGSLAFVLLAALTAPSCAAPHRSAAPALHVSGNRLLDGKDRPIALRGVDLPGLEWSVTGDHSLESAEVATQFWNARLIRLPLCEDSWFGKNSGQTDGGAAYRDLVHQIVKAIASRGAYVVLDLHWSDGDRWGTDIGQHKMPDNHSLAFWRSVAGTYANAPSVMFDLYNEPHDISWNVWKNGGTVTDHSTKDAQDNTYITPGMQALLDTVRSTGARNVVIAGGPGWASDFKGLFAGDALTDPTGNGVMYADHFYPFGDETVDQWESRMELVSAKYPIYVGEFGSDPPGGHGESGSQWVRHVLSVLDAHDWSWTAWCLHPSATPSLISDWNYTPTSHFGVYVKQALAELNK